MSTIIYNCIAFASYFLIMIACSIVAIIFSKRLFSWCIFLPGAFIQLLALIGTRKELIRNYSYSLGDYNTRVVNATMLPYWIVYVLLFIITSLILILVYRHNSIIYRCTRKDKYAIVCERCGNEFNKNEARCPKCGNKNIYG